MANSTTAPPLGAGEKDSEALYTSFYRRLKCFGPKILQSQNFIASGQIIVCKYPAVCNLPNLMNMKGEMTFLRESISNASAGILYSWGLFIPQSSHLRFSICQFLKREAEG